MRVFRIKNTSNECIEIRHKSGAITTLPPGVETMDIDIINIDEIMKKSVLVHDLGEVNERSGMNRLNG